MDNCLSTKGSWAKDKKLYDLFLNANNYNISYIITMGYPLGISPNLRTNFDYVFLFGDDNAANQKRMRDHYAGMLPSFNIFRQIFQQLTANNGCMVIKNKGSKSNFLDKIARYKSSYYDKI